MNFDAWARAWAKDHADEAQERGREIAALPSEGRDARLVEMIDEVACFICAWRAGPTWDALSITGAFRVHAWYDVKPPKGMKKPPHPLVGVIECDSAKGAARVSAMYRRAVKLRRKSVRAVAG